MSMITWEIQCARCHRTVMVEPGGTHCPECVEKVKGAPALRAAVENWKAQLEAHPDYQRMRHQRNVAIATALILAAWSIFCIYLAHRFMERAL